MEPEKMPYPPNADLSQPPPYQPTPYPTDPSSLPPYQPTAYPTGPPQHSPYPTAPHPQPQPQQQYIPTAQPYGQTRVILTPIFGETPVQTTCPNCQSSIVTATVREDSVMQHVMCFVMCLVGLYCCSCIPYCMDSMQNVKHICPRCNAHLGTHKP